MTRCAECFFGGKTCGTKGDPKSPFVIIGESPGALELAENMPFVGPSGDLLHSILNEFADKLKVEPYYIHAFNCLPRNKQPKKIAAAAKACNGRMINEIAKHPRKVILALGNAAVWSITGNYDHKITKIRGQLFASDYASEGIVASTHPSYILRGGGNLSQLKRDILYALSLLSDEEFAEDEYEGEASLKPVIRAAGTYREGYNKILETPEQVKEFCDKLKTLPGELVGSDFETDGFDPLKDERFIDPPHFFNAGVLCGGFSYCDEYNIIIPGHLLTDEIFHNDCRFGWHNGKFDMKWGRNHGMPSLRVDEDSMLLSYVLNEIGGMHDLEQVGGDWLNAPNYKAMLEKYLPDRKTSYEVIPKDVLYKYQGLDSGLTRQIINVMRPRVNTDARLRRVYEEILIPATEHLYHLENSGFLVCQDQLQSNLKGLREVIDTQEKIFCDISEDLSGSEKIYGGKKKQARANIRSPLQVEQVLYGQLKLGNMGMGTDVKTLERLPDHPITLALRKHRKVQKLSSTYVRASIDKSQIDGRVHTTFKIHGTATGRLSSNQPNVQNVPRNPAIRGQYTAPPGRVILECDLGQAELRMLAQLSKDKALCAIFCNGEQSLHDEVAIELFGEGFSRDEKVAAKCVNFGIVYGITAPGLADRVSFFTKKPVPIADAQAWIDGWSKRFPQAWDFIQRCRNAVTKKMTLVSAFGRKRRFNIVTPERLQGLQNEAANFPHQSGASDITLIAGMQLRASILEEFDALMVNTVHDCLVVELPDDIEIISACARKIISVLMDVPKQWDLNEVPFTANSEVGYRWGNCHEFDPFAKEFLPGERHYEHQQDKQIQNLFTLNRNLAPGLLEAVESME